MNTPSLFRYQAIGHKGPVSANIAFRQGRAPAVIYYDPDLRTPARNPAPTDSMGRVNLYMNAGESYEVTVRFPDGTTDQFMHTAIPIGATEIIREPAPDAITVERVVHQDSPETLAELERLRGIEKEHARAALMAGLAKLEDAKERMDARAPDAAVVETLVEHGLSISDTYERVSDILVPKYAHAKNAAEYARQNGSYEGKGVIYWEEKAERYGGSLKWNRGRMAETV
ncbi:hypothetical protein [Hyphomonas sp.]|uniref:hypothetical protein n=1 Tax=Hyphomonas sp. TaxID=87 RepID=UPI0035621FD9